MPKTPPAPTAQPPARSAQSREAPAPAPIWERAQNQLPPFPAGEVWLVGAGPGAPELLTLAAVHALAHATDIFHDALINPAVLALAGKATTLHDVGRRAGKKANPQTTDKMIALARTGGKIVRLKGGDPYLFGRGAEESAALLDAGINFRIVPGLTAALGGLSFAGIPLTHRQHTHAVAFVTGHKNADVDWQALAQGAPVIVIYMGLREAATIQAKLLAAGRKPTEPATIVLNATLPTQEIRTGTLANLANLAKKIPKGATALIILNPLSGGAVC